MRQAACRVGFDTRAPAAQLNAKRWADETTSAILATVLAHYLPKMYLNRFATDGRLAVFDRRTGKLRRDKPRNVATIKDFYIITDASGKRDDSVETHFLAELEGQASPIIDSLCGGGALSPVERQRLATFLGVLCTRMPFFADAHAELNQNLARVTFRRLAGTPERAAKFLSRRKRSFPFSPTKFARFVNSDALTIRPKQAERIQIMIEMAQSMAKSFMRLEWRILKAPESANFITSDAPMGLVPLPGALPTYGESSSLVMKFFALSPRVCLRLSDNLEPTCISPISIQEVSRINEAIALEATRLLIGRNESDLDTVLHATNLRMSSFVPTTALVEWYDQIGNRSFTMSVRVHNNTRFPLRLPQIWCCRSCSHVAISPFFISSSLTPLRPDQYSLWLDKPCEICGVTPRQSASTLTNRKPFNLVPREDG